MATMTINRYIAAMAIAASATAAVNGQNLKTEITVDRTIVPVEREASRLGSLVPRMLPMKVNQRQLTQADYSEASGITRSAVTLSPAAYADTFALSPYKGYASIGYFPAFNLGASAGYRFISNDRTRLGAWLQYDGCSYKPSLADEPHDGSYKDNTFTVGVRLDQKVGSRSVFGADLAFTHSATGLPDAFINNSQHADIFDVALSWNSRLRTLGWYADAAFSHFGYGGDNKLFDDAFKLAADNRITVKGGVAYYGASQYARGGIDIAADFLSRSNGEEINFAEHKFVDPAGTLGVVSLTPYYGVVSEKASARIGARIDLSTGGEGKKFHIAPSVMLDWNPSRQFAVYARINGGEQLNSLRSLFDYCHFMPGMFQYQRSHIPVVADLGINIGPFTGFSARIFGGYAVANDWLMPTVTRDANDYLLAYAPYDLKGWHAGVGLGYECRFVKADVSAETASHNGDKAYYLWRDRAKYVLRGAVDVRPIEALTVGVSYELRSGRNYCDDWSGFNEIDLRSVSNLGLKASYTFTPAFTVFANVENLLNHRYYQTVGIEAQGLKGLVGVAYKF